jgi:hypothetical protein
MIPPISQPFPWLRDYPSLCAAIIPGAANSPTGWSD